jgi:hypothetical protein
LLVSVLIGIGLSIRESPYDEQRRRFSPENLDKLEVGMTLKELEEIFGPGKRAIENDDAKYALNKVSSLRSSKQNAWIKAIRERRVRLWEGFGHTTVLALFSDNPSSDSKVDVLVRGDWQSAVQIPPDKWAVTKDNFVKLRVGMTLKELEDIIGVGEPAVSSHYPWSTSNNRQGKAWEKAVNENRAFEWKGGEGSDRASIFAGFSEPPSLATKAEALSYVGGEWVEDKGSLSGAKK